ncbi:MAG TPA: hypothetical protein VNM92_00535 [Thermoanaerobaculia bacterium]|nr:hypothetical protein [Thermoanaerobaculia bacterium]
MTRPTKGRSLWSAAAAAAAFCVTSRIFLGKNFQPREFYTKAQLRLPYSNASQFLLRAHAGAKMGGGCKGLLERSSFLTAAEFAQKVRRRDDVDA